MKTQTMQREETTIRTRPSYDSAVGIVREFKRSLNSKLGPDSSESRMESERPKETLEIKDTAAKMKKALAGSSADRMHLGKNL